MLKRKGKSKKTIFQSTQLSSKILKRKKIVLLYHKTNTKIFYNIQ